MHDSFSLGKTSTHFNFRSTKATETVLSLVKHFGLHYTAQGALAECPVMYLHLTKCLKLLVNVKQLSNPTEVIRISQMLKVKYECVFLDRGSGEYSIVVSTFSIKHQKKIWIFKILFDHLKQVGILTH